VARRGDRMLKMIEKSLTIDSNEGPIRCLRSMLQREAPGLHSDRTEHDFSSQVCGHTGCARMHYAVPSVLAQAGMLEVSIPIFMPVIGRSSWGFMVAQGDEAESVQRLLGRRLPAVLAHTTRTYRSRRFVA